jgi:outer membrane protein assembly factor BamB
LTVAARARSLPLAVLLAVTGLVAILHKSASRAPDSRVATSAPGSSGSSTNGVLEAGSLAGPPPPEAARVAARSGRMIHEDPRHTHRARGHGPRRATLVWKLFLDGPIEAQVATSADGETLYVATLGGSLTAVSREGVRRWTVPLGGRGYASPTVAEDGTIYVGSDAGALLAVSPSGAVKWKLETGGEADTGSVILPDGTLALASGSAVLCVRPTGDLAWRFVARGKVFTAPAVTEDGLVVFGSQDDHAYALTSAGALSWATDLGADVDGAPAIGDDGAIFVGTDAGELVRLGGRGEIVWRTKLGGFVRGALSVARNGDVLAGVYGPLPRQVRVAPDGAVRGWLGIPGTGSTDFGVHGGALEDDEGTLVFGAQDDRVRAVSRDGALLWSFLAGGDVDAPVTLTAAGMVVVGADDGTVYALADEPPK